MLYNFNGTLVNMTDIVSVNASQGHKAETPWVLTVSLRNGQQFAVAYESEVARRKEITNIARAYDRSVPQPISSSELENVVAAVVSKYTEKLKKELKLIKQLTQENARQNMAETG